MTLKTVEKYTQAYDWPAGYPWVRNMAEEVEREVAERYMELPVDADGAPIHVGDELEWDWHRDSFIVTSVSGDSVWYCEACGWKAEWANATRHVRPDTWERIVQDAIHCGFVGDDGSGAGDEAARDLVTRCKALAGEVG